VSSYIRRRWILGRSSASGGEPLRIVAIGGGTGLSSLLRGLKAYSRSPWTAPGEASQPAGPVVEVTAVVTVTDDGGSSGRLRRQLAVAPPGDIRNCMVALSEDEALLSRLFQYRFSRGHGLRGHSFGNLFLTALAELTGDFAQAVRFSSEVLASRGRIFPSTDAHVTLEAELDSGRLVAGETRISRSRRPIRRIALKPARCRPLTETIEAISEADLICFGPGSLYTSVIPNLLVSGIPRAIRRSPALKAYFVNLMWQPGETMGFCASDHIRVIREHAGQGLFDIAVVNTRPITGELRRRYAAARVFPVENDVPRLAAMGIRVVGRNLLAHADKVRHDPESTAAIAIDLAAEGRARRLHQPPAASSF
jgi:uncharacterized cofD-like protein